MQHIVDIQLSWLCPDTFTTTAIKPRPHGIHATDSYLRHRDLLRLTQVTQSGALYLSAPHVAWRFSVACPWIPLLLFYIKCRTHIEQARLQRATPSVKSSVVDDDAPIRRFCLCNLTSSLTWRLSLVSLYFLWLFNASSSFEIFFLFFFRDLLFPYKYFFFSFPHAMTRTLVYMCGLNTFINACHSVAIRKFVCLS